MPERTDKSNNQKDAESKVQGFQEKLGPFVVAAETTRMAMVFTDAKEPGNPIIFANDSFLTLIKYNRDEVLGQSFNFLVAQEANPDALAAVDAAFESSPDNDPQIHCRRKDDS